MPLMQVRYKLDFLILFFLRFLPGVALRMQVRYQLDLSGGEVATAQALSYLQLSAPPLTPFSTEDLSEKDLDLTALVSCQVKI
jgi:hypothetical protein